VIHPNAIKRRADEDGVAAPTVERDYILTHVLTSIAAADKSGQLVFKGGTALRLWPFRRLPLLS
jgi:predicted nucleotidyltransferase component of viral defense system